MAQNVKTFVTKKPNDLNSFSGSHGGDIEPIAESCPFISTHVL